MQTITSKSRTAGPLDRRIDRWRQVIEATTAMTAAPDGGTLANTIETVVPRTLNAESCLFLVYDTTLEQIVFEAPEQPYHHRKPTAELEGLHEWLAGWTAPAVVADSRNAQWPAFLRSAASKSPRAMLVVPEKVDDTLIGYLLAYSRSAKASFSDEDLEIARALARHAGLAVKHTLLYEAAQQEMAGRTALYEVGKRISSSLNLDEVLDLIIDSLYVVVPYDAAMIFLLNRDHNVIEMQTVRGYDDRAVELCHLKVGEGLSGWAAKTGQAVIVPDVRRDARYANLRPETRSEMAVPLVRGDEIIGVFNIESDRVNAYDDRDLALLEAFASQATIAIQNARLYQESIRTKHLEKELEVAGEIQRALMPRNIPHVQGLTITVLSEPSAEVGGDFYDVLNFADKYLGLAVGDVVGKGVPGAITMASLYTAFHEYATDPLMTPSDVMERVNAMLHEVTEPDRFATLFYGVLSLRDGKFRYCNAGHNPPILCRPDGTVEYLNTGGLVLGPFPESTFKLGETDLNEGDVLVLYTDGVTEALNEDQEEFDLERLERVIHSCSGLSADEIKACLTQTLLAFTGDAPQHDDITVIILKADREFRQEMIVV